MNNIIRISSLININIFIICSLFFSTMGIQAAVPIEQANRLNSDLTPIGAIRKGNADGSIPAWSNKHSDKISHSRWLRSIEKEKPLFVINNLNVDDHRNFLSLGLQKLIALYPDTFNIPVYQSHRTAVYPQWLYDNAYKNALDAEISEDGEEVTFAWQGIPFPIPESAKEIMWNHQLRWKGLYFQLDSFESMVASDGSYSMIQNMLEVYSVYHNKDREPKIDDWRYIYYLSYIKAPASIAGGAYLSHESMKPVIKPRQAWMYLAGQRRLRRSPVMGYDSPTFTSDGLRMMDEIDMFNGAMDRYDWQLKGTKEMYIPYNNGVLQQALKDPNKLLLPHHLNPKYTRYEKHRVWVVDAVLKPGKSHIYNRRTFYIDEDTWGVMLSDIYDEHGILWRVPQRYAVFYEDIPTMMTAVDSFSDLKKKNYYLQGIPKDKVEHSMIPPAKGYFSPTSVRMRMRR
jgi:hypothetical protein